MKHLHKLAPIFILFCMPSLLSAITFGDELQKGIQLFNAGDVNAAKQIFRNIVEESPNNAEANYYLGRIFLKTDSLKKAESFCKKAVELDPNNSLYHLWLANFYGVKVDKVSFFKKLGTAKKIKKHFLRAVELDKNNNIARFSLIRYYTEAPGIAGGDKKEARRQIAILKEKSPYLGYFAAFRLYFKEKKYELAEQECAAALSDFPDSTNVLWNLGSLYLKQKKFSKAASEFEESIKKRPDQLYAWYQIGKIGALSGQNLDRSEECLHYYIGHHDMDRRPKIAAAWQAAAYWRLGMIYEHKDEKEMACTSYRKSLKLNPDLKEARKALKKLKCHKH